MIKSLYPQFQRWSATGSIYIISDTHFDDADCKLMDANWITPEKHMANISQVVTKSDTLIHLGDVGNPEYLDPLKCYKVLITGNHDILGKLKDHFNETYTGPLFIADRLLLSHEPVFGLENICVNIHGHNHAGPWIYYNEDCSKVTHINLAANIAQYEVYNLGKAIKDGLLSKVENYHRQTIDKATEKKKERETKKEYEAQITQFNKELTEIYSNVDLKLSPIEWQPNFNRDSCQYCPNNPKNGGSGFCHCILGTNIFY